MPLPKPARKTSNTPSRISHARLAAMIEEATVDAYGDSEQTTGGYTMLEEHLVLPFETTVLGVLVNVATLDLPLPRPKPVGAEWIDAYRHWVGG